MTDLTIPASAPQNTPGSPGPKNTGTVSLQKGIGVLLLVTVLFTAIGLGIGHFFFWNRYDKGTLLDHEFADNLAKVKADPNNPLNHVQLGWDYFLMNKNENAVGEFKKALSLDPKNYAAHYDLGLSYMSLKRYDQAAESLKNAIQIVPNAFDPHLNLAISYFYIAKYDDALKELSLAYKANPGSPETMYWRGMVYEKQGKYQDALQEYQTAVNFEPNYADAREAYARVAKQVKK